VRSCSYSEKNILHVDLANDVCGLESHCGIVSDADCKILSITRTEYCCCKNLSSGELTTNRKCNKIITSPVIEGEPSRAMFCSEEIFSGADIGGTTIGSSPDFPSFNLDDSGGCQKWESEEAPVAGGSNKSFDAGKELGKEAANALNPMKFKLGLAGANDFIGKVVASFFFSIGSLLLLFYIYAGILWMTSAGNSEKVGKAKQIVVWSTLGVVVMLASYMIVSFVLKFFG